MEHAGRIGLRCPPRQATARAASRQARLDEVRAAVERDLLHDRTEQGRSRFYTALLDKYKVRVEER
jgi:hypothetical protein